MDILGWDGDSDVTGFVLEQSGHWLQALHCLRYEIRSGGACNAETWHKVGRLHQRLANFSQASRAYTRALLLMPTGLALATIWRS